MSELTQRPAEEFSPDIEAVLPVGDAAVEVPQPVRRMLRRRGWLIRRLLLAADLAGLTLAFLLSELLRGGGGSGAHNVFGLNGELLVFFATLPAWILVAKLYGLYDHDEERTDPSTVDEFVGVFHLITVSTWLFFVGTALTGAAQPDWTKLVTFWSLATLVVPVLRISARAVAHRTDAYLQNTLIVGAGTVGQLVGRKLLNHPEYGLNLLGFVDAEPKERDDGLGDLTVLGTPEDVPKLVRQFDVERVIIAFSNESHDDTIDLIRQLSEFDIQVDIVPRLFDVIGLRIELNAVEGLQLISLPRAHLSRSSLVLKRALDLCLSTAALILIAPFLLSIAVAIKLQSRGPVIFRQRRVGAKGEPFVIYKFRTMDMDADRRKESLAHLNKHGRVDARMFKIIGDPRVTRVGRFLRRYSLDELPQLVNVVRGEMSLVGPRPLVLEEDRYVKTWARRRLDLKPGITGLWQVAGRSDIPFEEMVKLDYLYVTGWSLSNDLKLVGKTIKAILLTRSD